MAGKFTRESYDKPAYSEALSRSTEPMLYRLDPNFAINCQQCFPSHGPRNGIQNTMSMARQTDIDSTLKGINRINSKSNIQQMPQKINPIQTNLMNCPDQIETEYTKFTFPAYDIKGLNVRDLRFDYPLYDPQCQIFENFAINTRLAAKDNHKAIWQESLNQRDLFPTERLGKPKKCNMVACNYAPYTS